MRVGDAVVCKLAGLQVSRVVANAYGAQFVPTDESPPPLEILHDGYDPRMADVFSLGKVMAFIQSKDPSDGYEEVEELVEACCGQPEDRPSAKVVARAMSAIRDGADWSLDPIENDVSITTPLVDPHMDDLNQRPDSSESLAPSSVFDSGVGGSPFGSNPKRSGATAGAARFNSFGRSNTTNFDSESMSPSGSRTTSRIQSRIGSRVQSRRPSEVLAPLSGPSRRGSTGGQFGADSRRGSIGAQRDSGGVRESMSRLMRAHTTNFYSCVIDEAEGPEEHMWQKRITPTGRISNNMRPRVSDQGFKSGKSSRGNRISASGASRARGAQMGDFVDPEQAQTNDSSLFASMFSTHMSMRPTPVTEDPFPEMDV